MIFPQYDYKVIDYTNAAEWCNIVNEAIDYCKGIKDIFEFEGKCRLCDLPSFHPIWKWLVSQEEEQSTKRLICQYNECVRNPELIKYYFGITSLADIKNKIDLKNSNKLKEHKRCRDSHLQ